MTRFIFCVKFKAEKEGLDAPPYPGPLGQRIYDAVSKEAWQGWLKHQTLLINEHRLNMTKPEDRHFLKTEMERYFFGDGGATPSGYTPARDDP